MEASVPDYYAILQVHPQADQEVIEAAYRRLARKYHPDVNPGLDSGKKMAELNAAYEVLSDPQKRVFYDAYRARVHIGAEDYDEAKSAPHDGIQRTKRRITWWRWLLILPVAVGGYVAFQLLVIIGNFWVPEDSLANLLWVRIIAGSIAPAAGFVLAGSKVAPSRRTEVSVALAIVYAAVTGGFAVLVMLAPQMSLSDPKALVLVSAILGLMAAGVACYMVYRDELKERSPMSQIPAADLGMGDWYFRPSWRSFFTWPLAIYFWGGVVYGGALLVALQIDFFRSNFIAWMIIGHVLIVILYTPFVGAYWVGFGLTASIWLSARLKPWWGAPVKLLLTGLVTTASTILSGLAIALALNVVAPALGVNPSASHAVLEFFSQVGLWHRIVSD